MASVSKIKQGISLEEFLNLTDIEEAPALEYIDGRIVRKAVPHTKHSVITMCLGNRMNAFAEPIGLGRAFAELRCTFDGRSIVPDIVFLRAENIAVDERGEFEDETPIPPDIHVEIISPKQTVKSSHGKLTHSTSHGCSLGLLIHPKNRTIAVYRPGRMPERLSADGAIDFAPVLPGLILPVAEVFGWLVYRRPGGE